MAKKKWSIKIGWGRDGRDPGDELAAVTTHEFGTHRELEAFLQGVSASSGWSEYTIHDGDPVSVDEMDGLYDDLRD